MAKKHTTDTNINKEINIKTSKTYAEYANRA